LSSRAFRVAVPTVFAEAGIAHNDVDHLMIYDAFARLRITASAWRDQRLDGRGLGRTRAGVFTAEAVIKARLAAAEAGRPKAEPAPGSLEYQALHPEWKPEEE
jgi:hypothetical protein